MSNKHCTTHCTLNIYHCRQYTTHFTLQTKECTPNTVVHCTLHTALQLNEVRWVVFRCVPYTCPQSILYLLQGGIIVERANNYLTLCLALQKHFSQNFLMYVCTLLYSVFLNQYFKCQLHSTQGLVCLSCRLLALVPDS